LRYIAAVVGFIVTYFAATIAFAELTPASVYQSVFRPRPALLGGLIFLISLAGGVAAFWFMS